MTLQESFQERSRWDQKFYSGLSNEAEGQISNRESIQSVLKWTQFVSWENWIVYHPYFCSLNINKKVQTKR